VHAGFVCRAEDIAFSESEPDNSADTTLPRSYAVRTPPERPPSLILPLDLHHRFSQHTSGGGGGKRTSREKSSSGEKENEEKSSPGFDLTKGAKVLCRYRMIRWMQETRTGQGTDGENTDQTDCAKSPQRTISGSPQGTRQNRDDTQDQTRELARRDKWME